MALEISVTAAARHFLQEMGATSLTVSSLLFSSCCSGPLPPEVKPGAPLDADGFARYETDGLTLFFDSLIDPRPALFIDLKDYGSYRELIVNSWE